eukprot:Skav219420  [mRNA]  locus=scaffold571:114740:125969:- [translate_table: standard]
MMKSVVLLAFCSIAWGALLEDALQQDDCQGSECQLQLLQTTGAALRALANSTEAAEGCPTCHLMCWDLPRDKFACTDRQTLLGQQCYDRRIAQACPKTCGCCKTCSICKIPTSCY